MSEADRAEKVRQIVHEFIYEGHLYARADAPDYYVAEATHAILVLIAQEIEEHMRPTDPLQEMMSFNVNNYRDIDLREYIQVTVKCMCGRGGFVRMPDKEGFYGQGLDKRTKRVQKDKNN